MKQILILILIICSLSNTYSQITNAEYFFDTEPSFGSGTALTITAGNTINETHNINVSALSPGFHTLYLRTQNANNVWSIYHKKTFYISQEFAGYTVADITDAEYYYDTDPGFGNGTTITIPTGANFNEIVNLDTSGLSQGFHKVFIRTKNANNVWSIYDYKAFYISELYVGTSTTLVAAEYFIDTQETVGNGTPITLVPNGNGSYDTTISPTGLAEGDHLLFLRTQNSDGIWSLYDVVSFTVDNTASMINNDLVNGITLYPNPTIDIIKLDTKYQLKNYQIINVNGKNVQQGNISNKQINVSNLANGTYFTIITTASGKAVKQFIKQ